MSGSSVGWCQYLPRCRKLWTKCCDLVGEELRASILEAVDEVDNGGLVVVIQFHQVRPRRHRDAAVVLWAQRNDDLGAVPPCKRDQLVDDLGIVRALEADPDPAVLQIVDHEFVWEFAVVVSPVRRLGKMPA